MQIAIIGAGIAGLTLALELHAAGIEFTVYEAAPELQPLGVGINVLPHASAILAELGLEADLAAAGITTRESAFFNRFGQLVYREPAGRWAGNAHPQFSIHRGDLHRILLDAVRQRAGADRLALGRRCVAAMNVGPFAEVALELADGTSTTIVADAVVACDGVHSHIRKQLHPQEGSPRYSGVNMWRGTAVLPPFLTGATMVRAGWLATGKMVIYPIRADVDGNGHQLVNWVAEIETPLHAGRDWTRVGRRDDFLPAFADWHFDWLDVPAMIESCEEILEYPMVDQDPVDFWTQGRITLLGDAAHPMVPRGSNGAGQAILDARGLRQALQATPDVGRALLAYEATRLPATSAVVRTNRSAPPDAILREVWKRTGDQPFERIEEVIGEDEMRDMAASYRRVVGLQA